MQIRSEIGAICAAFLVCVWLVFAGQNAPAESLVNHKAPQFAGRGLDGHTIDLHHLRGKVVLLNFWATWCAPCAAEMPAFARWQHQYGSQGLAVVGVSMDDRDPPVRKLLQRLHIDYPVTMGSAALGERYGGVLGLPETFLIDRAGTVRAQFQGESDLNKIEATLKTLLAKH